MSETRQSLPPARGRSILALSTLALLAFCCLPVLAYGSSAGIQYQDAAPTATGKPPSEKDHDGSQSTSGAGSSTGKSSSTGGDPAGKSSDEGSGGAAAKDGGGSGSGGANAQQGSQGKDGKAAPISGEVASNTEPGSDDGGTSPWVLILMAVLVLGVGSVAYVAVKRRRGDGSDSADSSGSPVSPEAS